jgi:hypothetical protein
MKQDAYAEAAGTTLREREEAGRDLPLRVEVGRLELWARLLEYVQVAAALAV